MPAILADEKSTVEAADQGLSQEIEMSSVAARRLMDGFRTETLSGSSMDTEDRRQLFAADAQAMVPALSRVNA